MTAPERIWATPFDADMDGGTYCEALSRPAAPNHDARQYTRTDLIQPMIDKAVAEALGRAAYEVAELFEHHAEERNWRDGAKQAKRIVAAIRAMKPEEQK